MQRPVSRPPPGSTCLAGARFTAARPRAGFRQETCSRPSAWAGTRRVRASSCLLPVAAWACFRGAAENISAQLTRLADLVCILGGFVHFLANDFLGDVVEVGCQGAAELLEFRP